MHSTPASRMRAAGRLERVGLEMSLKPFSDWQHTTLETTIGRVFDDWSALIERAESVAVLLWVADGSEILEWDGDQDRECAWAHSVGFSNVAADPYGHNVTAERAAVPYRSNVPSLTYRDLRRVVAALKDVGRRITGKPITVGATFDAGPEFAESEFKYRRHPEIVALGEDAGIGKLIRMVDAGAVLDPDDRSYAAFPAGIPAGTSFGAFLGGQAEKFLAAMDFDYLWMSNGFGFSAYSWTPFGSIFDGNSFDAGNGPAAAQRMLGFWRDFADACSFPVEVRGTNFPVGIDLGSDAVPADRIYRAMRFRNPPPNSPWGPLNNDFGIEMAGYLSRIAVLPSDGFLFRFYLNDPWFWQNPWRDFYHREPFDIRMPLSVCRIDATGRVQTARDVQLLSVDTESGDLDQRTSQEVAAHIGRALDQAPDEAGPLVWLYPFEEYHGDVDDRPEAFGAAYFEDSLIAGAITSGLPLNTVVPTGNLPAALVAGTLANRIVVAPTRALTDETVAALVAAGVPFLAYGALARAGRRLASILQLDETGPLAGDLELRTECAPDRIQQGSAVTALRHDPALSGGPITEVLRRHASSARVVAAVSSGDQRRAYAVASTGGTAGIVWIRGSAVAERTALDHNGLLTPVPVDPRRQVEPAALLRRMLPLLGYEFGFSRCTASSPTAVQSVHTQDNARWVSGYLPDTTTRASFRFPEGAPMFTQQNCWYNGRSAEYQLGRCYHHEARLFVDQRVSGLLSCREIPPFPYGMRRALQLSGLTKARVLVRIPPGSDATFVVNSQPAAAQPTDRTAEYVLENVTGTLAVTWC